jgi:phage shock protein A
VQETIMGIFKRISDILSANFNELVDGFENPEKLLKQAIREMEESIAKATEETAKALASEKITAKALKTNQVQTTQWLERAEQAVQAGDDELARKAIKRKQEHEKLVAALEDQLTASQEAAQALKRQLEAMKAKLTEAKRSLANLSVRHRAAAFRKKMQTVDLGAPSELDQHAFAKFERLRNRVEQAEAEAEALSELQSATRTVDVGECCEPEANIEVDAELMALKQRGAKPQAS